MSKAVDTIQSLLATARQFTSLVPGLSAASPFIGAGEAVLKALDLLTNQPQDGRTREQIRVERAKLAAAVSAKAKNTAARFEG